MKDDTAKDKEVGGYVFQQEEGEERRGMKARVPKTRTIKKRGKR